MSNEQDEPKQSFLPGRKCVSGKKMAFLILVSVALPPVGLIVVSYYLYQSAKHRDKRLIGPIVYFLVALSVGVGIYGYLIVYDDNPLSHYLKTDAYRKDNNQYYDRLNAYQMEGKAGLTSFSFKKPEEFKLSSQKISDKSAVVSFADQNNRGNAIGFLTVSALNSSLAGNKDYREAVGRAVKESKGTGYDSFMSSLYKFVADTSSSKMTVTLEKPRSFVNGKITSNAWQFDVSVHSKPSDKQKFAPLKGRLILILADNVFYYYGLYAIDYNWESNSSVWQKMFDSIDTKP